MLIKAIKTSLNAGIRLRENIPALGSSSHNMRIGIKTDMNSLEKRVPKEFLIKNLISCIIIFGSMSSMVGLRNSMHN